MRIPWTVLMLLFSLLICCNGCNALEVNDSAIAVGLGADLKEDTIFFSAQLAKPSPPEEGGSTSEAQFLTVTGSGPTGAEAARSILLSLPRMPLWPHASIFVLGEELVKSDVSTIIDLISRNRNIRHNSTLVVSKNVSAREILEADSYLETYPAQAIEKMLTMQERELGIYVPTTIHNFLDCLSTEGIEPAVPQVSVFKEKEKNFLQLDGTAVFKDQKRIGELNETESRGYRWLQPGRHSGGLFVIPSPANARDSIALEVLVFQTRIQPRQQNGQLIMQIHIKADGNFLDQTGTDFKLSSKEIPRLEKQAAAEIEKQVRSCINKCQGLESDILGWGLMIKAADSGQWRAMKSDWDQHFASLPVEITVEYKIRRTYLMESSFQFRF